MGQAHTGRCPLGSAVCVHFTLSSPMLVDCTLSFSLICTGLAKAEQSFVDQPCLPNSPTTVHPTGDMPQRRRQHTRPLLHHFQRGLPVIPEGSAGKVGPPHAAPRPQVLPET